MLPMYTALSHHATWQNLGTYPTLDEALDVTGHDYLEPHGIQAAGDGRPSYWGGSHHVILREPPVPSFGLLSLRYQLIYSILNQEYVRRIPEYLDISRQRTSRLRSKYPHLRSALDIGCGTGQGMRALEQQRFIVTGTEISTQMAKSALREDHCAVINNSFMTIPHGPFHLVFDSATFHLYPSAHEAQIFARFRHLLTPGGVLTISTTISPSPSEGWESKADYPLQLRRYRRHFTPESLVATLQAHGFVLEDTLYGETSGKRWIAVTGTLVECKSKSKSKS